MFIFSLFIAGLVSVLSPCILPLLPVYLGVLTDQNGSTVKRTFLFILGVSTIFLGLGFGFGFISQYLYQVWFKYLMALIIILLGIHQLELIQFKKLNYEKRIQSSYANSYLLGLTFSFSWTPCVGPILATVLSTIAAQHISPIQGVFYLAIYTLGFAVPFVGIALLSNKMLQLSNKIKPHLPLIKKLGGILIIGIGIYTAIR
jgi:putative cytochrome c-type biogenesis protein